MAPPPVTLAWKVPWTEEPGRLQSMGSLGVGHGWVTSLWFFTFMHWRRKWQPTPVFLPRESQGWGSLVSCRLWDRTVRHDWSDLAAAAAGFCSLFPPFISLSLTMICLIAMPARQISPQSLFHSFNKYLLNIIYRLHAMWVTWVWSLGGEDPLGKGMVTHSSILAWTTPWTEEPGGLQSMVLQSQTQLSN